MVYTVDGSYARSVVLFQELYLQLFWQLCFASRAGAHEPGQMTRRGEGGGGRRRGRVGGGAGEEGETAGSSLGAVYSCTCVVGGGGGGGGVEGVVGEDEAYVIFFKHVWTFQNLR